jgi:hypothetical protein
MVIPTSLVVPASLLNTLTDHSTLHAELATDTVEGTNNPLTRNSAAMVLLANNNVPGSVSVPSGGGGEEDDCSFMDGTVHSDAGSVGAAAGITIHLCSGQHHCDFSCWCHHHSYCHQESSPLLCILLILLPQHFLVVPLI